MIRPERAAQVHAVDRVSADRRGPEQTARDLEVVSIVALHGALYRRLRARGIEAEEAAAQAADMAVEITYGFPVPPKCTCGHLATVHKLLPSGARKRCSAGRCPCTTLVAEDA